MFNEYLIDTHCRCFTRKLASTSRPWYSGDSFGKIWMEQNKLGGNPCLLLWLFLSARKVSHPF